MRTLFISLACAASLLSAQPVLAVPVSRIVAVVNGDMITARELDKAVQPELAGQKVDPVKNPRMAAEIRKAVLDRMINDKILLQEADKEDISVSDADVDAAIDWINEYGTHHSEAIVSENYTAVKKFLLGVDSACVYANASTRFSDGFEFGLGAEIGISTQKLHARGPMGLEALTTYKYVVLGDGQVRR